MQRDPFSTAASSPRTPSSGDRIRALISIAVAAGLGATALARAAAWVSWSLPGLYMVMLLASQLQWLNLEYGRSDSAFRSAGRALFRVSSLATPAGARPSPEPVRAAPLFLLEAMATMGTSLSALFLSCSALWQSPPPALYVAAALLACIFLVVIFFPRLGGR
jgi:hypothetical protein